MRFPAYFVLALSWLTRVATAQIMQLPDSGFSGPTGIAVDSNGNLFITDSGHGLIKEIPAFDANDTVRTLGTGIGPISGTAIDGAGNLFIADPNNSAVKELLFAGGYVQAVTVGSGFSAPVAVALDPNGNVFVSDFDFSRRISSVYEVLAAGGYTSVKLLFSGNTFEPGSLAVDGRENLFVIDTLNLRVLKATAADNYTKLTQIAVPALVSPSGIALDASGNLFVTESAAYGGNSDVREVLAASGYASVLTLGSGFDNPDGIAVDSRGNVFVADTGNNAIKELTAADGYKDATLLGSGFSRPTGILVDANGNLIVNDFGTSTLRNLTAASGYATVSTLWRGFNRPVGIAVDGSANLFIADLNDNAITEMTAASGYLTAVPLASGLYKPDGIAVDNSGNVFVAEARGGNDAIIEFAAADGYATTTLIGSGFNGPAGIAVDGSGNIFVSDAGNKAVKKIAAAGGYTTIDTLGSGFNLPVDVAVDSGGNVYVSDLGNNTVQEILASDGYATVKTLASSLAGPESVAVDSRGNVFATEYYLNLVDEIPAPPTTLAASVLPASRSVMTSATATVFATMVNFGTTTLDGCAISLAQPARPGLSLTYQTTDASTNAPTGTPNTPVTLAGGNGAQSFILSLTGTTPFTAAGMVFDFGCSGATPAAIETGVDTLDFTVSATPNADIIALAATTTGDATAHLADGSGAFAVATDNLGVGGGITIQYDFNGANLPLSAALCETAAGTGQCLAAPASTLTIANFAAGATPTFSIFLSATGAIPFDPANSRIFLRFLDSTGKECGATSVAVRTD